MDAIPEQRRKSTFFRAARSLTSHWARLKDAATAFFNGLLDVTPTRHLLAAHGALDYTRAS